MPKSTRPNAASLRRLARTATRVETGVTPRSARAADKLPDAATLIQRSHDKQLTGAALATTYATSTRTVYALLEEAGRSRDELWSPVKAQRAPHRDVTASWPNLLRDYKAGDSPLMLAKRYGIPQQSIDRNLKALDGVHVRSKAEGGELRAQQRTEADEVRYALRTGALNDAAIDLGIELQVLRAVLETRGLLLHDLPHASASD